MKSALLVFALSATLASPAFAQSAPAKPSFTPAPPPPGMNDPGVKPVAPEAAPAPTPQETPAEQTPTQMGSAPVINDGSGDQRPPPPQVTVRQEGDNTIEEYRQSGRVTMVVVTPKHGVPQTYNVDLNGQWHASGEPPVQPVMYKVLEWGKSKPASTDANAGDGGDTGGGSDNGGN